MGGEHQPVVIIQRNQPTVESPVQVGAEGNAVGDGIIMAQAPGFNMALLIK